MANSLSITIPNWSGSSSFTAGSTPFGFFDTDNDFTGSADKVASWCAMRLGYPFNDIELQAAHFYTCFEEAVLEYSNQVNQFSIRDNLLVGATLTFVAGTALGVYGKLSNRAAVMIVDVVPLRSVPTEVQQTEKAYPPGSIARREKEFLGWSKVRMPNNDARWIS